MLLCEGCEDELHLACRGLAALPGGDWFCRTCQPSASAKAAARVLATTEQVFFENICPLGYNLSVEKLFWSFFFSGFFKKKLGFFPGDLNSMTADKKQSQNRSLGASQRSIKKSLH